MLQFLAIDLRAIKKYFSLVELVILVSIRGSYSRQRIAMHRQLRQLLAIRLKKKEALWIRDALRFLGARSCFEGQSNGVKSPRVATRNVTKPWKRAGRASASHFPPRIPPHGPLLSFDFPRFPAE